MSMKLLDEWRRWDAVNQLFARFLLYLNVENYFVNIAKLLIKNTLAFHNLQMNTNDFSLKNYDFKKEKTLIFFGKEIKWKVVTMMHYCQAEIGIPPKIT